MGGTARVKDKSRVVVGAGVSVFSFCVFGFDSVSVATFFSPDKEVASSPDKTGSRRHIRSACSLDMRLAAVAGRSREGDERTECVGLQRAETSAPGLVLSDTLSRLWYLSVVGALFFAPAATATSSPVTERRNREGDAPTEINKRKCQSCVGTQCWDFGNARRTYRASHRIRCRCHACHGHTVMHFISRGKRGLRDDGVGE